MVVLKYLMLLVGFVLIYSIVCRLTKDRKGDEREKRIAQLAALSTWNIMISICGIQALFSIIRVNIPFITMEKVSSGLMFVILILFYVISYGFHMVRKSGFNAK